MRKQELKELNSVLIALLIEMRDEIDEKLIELGAVEDDDDENGDEEIADDGEDDDENEDEELDADEA